MTRRWKLLALLMIGAGLVYWQSPAMAPIARGAAAAGLARPVG